MKKNSEYIGVDEKFIPKNEKYVNDSILGSEEKSKKKIKKWIKIGIGIFVTLVLVAIIFLVVVVGFIFNHSKNMNQQIFGIFGNTLEQINNGDTEDKMNEIKDAKNSIGSMIDDFTNNQSTNTDKTAFNAILEIYSGTKNGLNVGSLLDRVVTINKTDKDHIITVIYNETTTTSEDEIVNIKHSLDKLTEYEVSLDYDANGFVNKVTIKNI